MHRWIFNKRRSTQNQSGPWRINTKEGKKSASHTDFGNRLLFLTFHFTHLDGDLLDFQVNNKWPAHIRIKAILFPQWVEYILNRSDLQHIHNKLTYVCAEFFLGCLKHAVHALHSKFAYVHIYASTANNLGSANFGEQTNSLSHLVPQPWVETQHCHPVVTQVCPVSSVCFLGHHWIRAQKNWGSVFSSISVNSNTWHMKIHAFGLWPPWVMPWHKHKQPHSFAATWGPICLIVALPKHYITIWKLGERLWHHATAKLSMWKTVFSPVSS